jgi:hypothetical protein
MSKRLPKNDIDAEQSAVTHAQAYNMCSARIKNWPTQERQRERLLAIGPERLTDADLLAIILRVRLETFKEGVPGKNAYDSAISMLKDFRGLRGLDRAHVQDLLTVPGLGPAKVAQIKAAFELGKRQEVVIAVFLNGQQQYRGETEITEGTPTQASSRRPRPRHQRRDRSHDPGYEEGE